MLITRAPLRVSFFGGGSDFPEYLAGDTGRVMASAIDKYSYVTASHFHSQLFDYGLRVSYSKGELVKEVKDLQHPVFRACLEHCEIARDIELHTVADLPAFSGLGASSSFTVALLGALYRFKGKKTSPLDLAYTAIRIERDVLGECVGMQDQTVSAVGGFNIIEFKAADDIKIMPLNITKPRLAELENHLLLVFTGITRRASDLEGQKMKRLELNRPILREMVRMVDRGFDILTGNGSLAPFGLLLDAAWKAKRRLDAGVTSVEIEAMYQSALAAGAWGGKLLGAGGGGFLLLCVPPEERARVISAFDEFACIPVHLNATGVEVIYNENMAGGR